MRTINQGACGKTPCTAIDSRRAQQSIAIINLHRHNADAVADCTRQAQRIRLGQPARGNRAGQTAR